MHTIRYRRRNPLPRLSQNTKLALAAGTGAVLAGGLLYFMTRSSSASAKTWPETNFAGATGQGLPGSGIAATGQFILLQDQPHGDTGSVIIAQVTSADASGGSAYVQGVLMGPNGVPSQVRVGDTVKFSLADVLASGADTVSVLNDLVG